MSYCQQVLGNNSKVLSSNTIYHYKSLQSYLPDILRDEKLIGIRHILNSMVQYSFRSYLKYFIHLRNNFHAGMVSC